MSQLEDNLIRWTKRPSDSEEAQCEAAERAIRRAIQDSSECAALDVTIFAQGSWAANTNVRIESDVDVNICLNSEMFFDIPQGTERSHYGIGPPPGRTFSEFKEMIGRALDAEFGIARRGDKAFYIKENTYRVHADAVPSWLYRHYVSLPNEPLRTVEGVAIVPDSGGLIINYPKISLANGIAKNLRTGRAYKRAVRILKRLRNTFRNAGTVGGSAPSFQIESLLYNLPDDVFSPPTWTETIRGILVNAYGKVKVPTTAAAMTEVNDVKKLFGTHCSWTPADAQQFLIACWNHLGLS